MRPESEADLAEVIQNATGPIAIRGGGTRDLWYGAGPMLETSGLSQIRLYEPGALTLVAGAGTTLEAINQLLAPERQRLAFEPPDYRKLLGRSGNSTLGGVVASNASGPRRLQSGACRDALLGLRFVDGQGMVVKTGGRVMKNVTGYDLVKLNAGAYGRLGVLSEVSVKLAAVPECEASLLLAPVSDPAGVMAKALATPFDLSAAVMLPDGQIALRLEGFEASIRYRSAALERRLGLEGRLLDDAASAKLWQKIRDVDGFEADDLILRLSIRPSRLQDLQRDFAAFAPRILADWGGGLVWLGLSGQGADLRQAVGIARDFCARETGHATIFKSPKALQDLPRLQPEPAAIAAIGAKLRQSFDPRGLFAPSTQGAM